ncbi:type II toxin-antitoxin system RelE/ParE family toxin [uncultured Sphingomonas sp.]|uniref:type II toxin-antitoxin system RelE/ParE family toxin n=1 Tax=uncultured Sphingomonas sp. TaxID=158754 RepID=UPI0035CC6B01
MRISWSRTARADQQRIWLFLAERSAAYADMAEARIESRVLSLAEFPRIGRLVAGTTVRRLSVAEFQYVIDYELADEGVRVLRIRSTREGGDRL